MRAIRIILGIALVVTIASPGAGWAKATFAKAACAVPRGWRVLTQDRYAVVIARRRILIVRRPSGQLPNHKYCSRSGGGFHPVPLSGGTGGCGGCLGPLPDQIRDLRLKGRYLAYDDSPRLGGGRNVIGPYMWIIDTRTGRSRHAGDAGATSQQAVATSPVELSDDGVAVRIATYLRRGGPITVVEALTPSSSTWLDDDSAPGSITDIQLYDCAAGCAPDTTVVAWTHDGQRRYATVTG